MLRSSRPAAITPLADEQLVLTVEVGRVVESLEDAAVHVGVLARRGPQPTAAHGPISISRASSASVQDAPDAPEDGPVDVIEHDLDAPIAAREERGPDPSVP